jgi:hypothetical protein
MVPMVPMVQSNPQRVPMVPMVLRPEAFCHLSLDSADGRMTSVVIKGFYTSAVLRLP